MASEMQYIRYLCSAAKIQAQHVQVDKMKLMQVGLILCGVRSKES